MFFNGMNRKNAGRKSLYVTIIAVLAFSVLSGCASKKDDAAAPAASTKATDLGSAPATAAATQAGDSGSKDAKKYAGKTITVGTEAGGPYSEFYKGLAKDFTDKTGINVKFMEVPHENMHERFITEAVAGTGAIDVYTTDQPWVSEFASRGFLEPLGKLISSEDMNDFIPAALDTVKFNNEIYGLPYLVHTPILYYRTDLFKAAGIEKAPTTWDEYRADAKKLTTGGVFGIIVEGKQHPEPVTHLLDRILQAGGAVLDDKNNVVIDSPQVLNAFKFMLGMQYEDKSSPPGAVSYDNADAHNLFLQGKVAMVSNWPYMYSMASDPAQSKVVGNYDVAIQPGGDKQQSAAWSWGFGVSTSSKNKEASMEFVKWSTSSEIVQKLGKKFINPVPRKSALDALKSDKDLKPIDLKAISIMSEAVDHGKSVTTTPKFPAIQDRLAVTLSKIMTKQSTPENELKAAASDIKKIMAE